MPCHRFLLILLRDKYIMLKVISPPAPFIFMDLRSTTLARDEEQFLTHRLLGGIVLFSRNFESPEQLAHLLEQVRAINPKLLFAVDQEGGRVQRFQSPFTSLPPMQQLGNIYQLDEAKGKQLAQDCAWLVGNELAAFGIHINFAPVLDIDFGRSKIIGNRSFGHRASIVTAMAGAYLEGIQSTHVLPVAKHFPGHGGVELDTHIDQPMDMRPFEILWESDLRPYRDLVNEIPAIMSSHVIFPLVSPLPVTYCYLWLDSILRNSMQSAALVFSDCLSMKAAHVAGPVEKRLRLARLCGCNYTLLCNQTENLWDILEAVEEELAGNAPLPSLPSYHSPLEAPLSAGDSLDRWQQLQSSEKYQAIRQELEALKEGYVST